MKWTHLIALCLSVASSCHAYQVLREYDWDKAPERNTNLTIVQADGRRAAKVTNTNAMQLRVRLLTITNPPITEKWYSLIGDVKYENVEGSGYLEMWNYIQPLTPGVPEAGYFSRTLAESGPLGKLTGTESWRGTTLPFDRSGGSGTVTRLEVNLCLPSRGTVLIGPLKLQEYKYNPFTASSHSSGAWWTERTAGWIGAILGTVVGCLGSLLARMAASGTSRGFVMGASMALIALGVVFTIAGAAALIMHQPYAVWFLLLLCGVLLITIFPFRLRSYQKHYAEMELRRMNSIDA